MSTLPSLLKINDGFPTRSITWDDDGQKRQEKTFRDGWRTPLKSWTPGKDEAELVWRRCAAPTRQVPECREPEARSAGGDRNAGTCRRPAGGVALRKPEGSVER